MNDDVKQLGSGLKKENYAFTVDAIGTPWDVYYLTDRDGKEGMIAFRLKGEQWEIGFLQAGEFTPEQVAEALEGHTKVVVGHPDQR